MYVRFKRKEKKKKKMRKAIKRKKKLAYTDRAQIIELIKEQMVHN